MAVNQQKLMGRTSTVQSAAIAPQQQLVASPADTALLKDISKSLTNIIQLLSQQNVQTKRDADETRKTQERSRRQGIETGLEKTFATVKNVASAVVAPVKSILDQIIQFFVTVFLGRALILLLNWFADENNRSKVRSIMRFLQDWWPSLVAGYILFGTGFGRVVRKVAGVAIGATARLAVIAARLVKAIATGKGLKGAAAAFSGGGKLGGLKGFALRGGIAAAATIGTGFAINRMMGGGEEQAPQINVPEAPAVPALGASTGGLANLKDLFNNSTSGLSSKFNPFTSFFSSGGLASLMQGMNGVVSGPKGIDKVPAMLTDGEFVMSRGAVQKFGVSTLQSMNAAGGGTNQPKIIRGVPHAAGGGLIGGVDELRQKYDAKHGAGTYDKESARRRASLAQEDAAAEAKKGKKPTYVQSNYVRQLKERARTQGNTNYTSVNGIRIPGVKFDPKMLSSKPGSISGDQIANSASSKAKNLFGSVSAATGIGSGKLTAEQQRRINADNAQRNSIMQQRQQRRDASKEARAEYLKILRDQSHPLHDQAAFGNLTLSEFKKNYKPTITAPTTPAATGSKPGMGYTPYQSKFAGARDAAFAKARTMGGSPAFKSQDYYKANTAAREKQLSGLTSQQRLNALSLEGKNPRGSKGKRFDAQSKAQSAETASRGGMMGQLGRSFTKMFGSEKDKARVVSQDKASDARVKQAGAASIGRYYSSSDGKYYANFAAANKARIARQKPKARGITPTPKPKPKVVTKPIGSGKGGGLSKPRGGKPSTPKFNASSGSNRKSANIYGIK
jgi:hypothetical protein